MTPEPTVVGLGLVSCDVEIEMPLVMSALADPIVNPVTVTYATASRAKQPLVMVRTIAVAVGSALEAAKPLAIVTVGVAVEAKKPLG